MDILTPKLKGTLKTVSLGMACVLAVALLIGGWGFSDGSATSTLLQTPTAVASVGAFDIHVTESAVLDARQSVTLSSELPGNKAKIVQLAAEGTLLQPGDVVARFDPSPFEEDITRIRAEIREAQAVLVQVEAELQQQVNDGRERAAEVANQIVVAGIQRDNFRDADMPVRLRKASQEAQRAQSDFERARQHLQTQEELLARGFAKERDVQEARDAVRDLKAAHEFTAENVKLLKTVTLPAELKQAELAVENKQRELESHRQSQLQALARQRAVIMRAESRLEHLQRSLAEAEGYLARTVLTASVPGLILYKQLQLTNEKRKAQVGDSLWNSQGFAVIPDLSSLVANVRVRESDIGRIRVGQATKVMPEAYPNLALAGTVEAIGTLAADREDASEASRYFTVRIALKETDERLRPGMSARAVVHTGHFEDVVRIPVEAVFYQDETPVGFVLNGDRASARELTLGEGDGQFVIVTSGIAAGERVSLVYPANVYAAAAASRKP